MLIGDPLRLSQVLINLAGNAVKFTEQGEVMVRVERARETSDQIVLRFTVKDTGIGMSQKEIDKLFQAIYPGRFQHHPQIRRNRPGADDQ